MAPPDRRATGKTLGFRPQYASQQLARPVNAGLDRVHRDALGDRDLLVGDPGEFVEDERRAVVPREREQRGLQAEPRDDLVFDRRRRLVGETVAVTCALRAVAPDLLDRRV